MNDFMGKKAYITLEASIILPIFMSIILTFASFLQIFLAYNCMAKSLDKVSYFFSSYALLYHEKGINRVKDIVSSELSEFTEISDLLSNTIDLRKGLNYADDLMYQQIAVQIFKYYLEKDPFYKSNYAKVENITLFGSTFFNENDDIFLNVSGKVKIVLPLYEKFLSGFIVSVSQKSRGWLKGDMSYFTVSNEDDESVWNLNNFDRGKKLREIFGGNLPEFFPVISYFSNGVAIMVKSIDHTTQTYNSSYEMTKSLNEMADSLFDFEYANYNSGNNNINIQREDIQRKVLMLIMPTNQLSSIQQIVINDFLSYCYEKNIKLDIRRYQKSNNDQ